MAESLTSEEHTHFLAYGDPKRTESEMDAETASILDSFDDNLYTDNDSQFQCPWISTLDSTTYPGLTFGYLETP